MPSSVAPIASRAPIAVPSLPNPNVLNCRSNRVIKHGKFNGRRMAALKMARNLEFAINSVSKDGSASVGLDVPFPSDYSELLKQAKEATSDKNNLDAVVKYGNQGLLGTTCCIVAVCSFHDFLSTNSLGFLLYVGQINAKEATELALKDKKQLMEIEFPTAGLESVPGDGEGGIEMTDSMQLIREFCDCFINPEKVTRTRIFFPEASEVEFARKSVFGGASFKLDYLTKPSFFEDFGFVSKVKMADRVKPEDELFLVAYPYFNVNEMLVVEELYKEAVENTARKLIIFNGELDRIRSGYYPSFFYPKLAALSKTLLPKMETIYYIHNFKGRNGGTLFRCYPAPWKVLRKVRNNYICLHQQELMPSLKEVALDILPSA